MLCHPRGRSKTRGQNQSARSVRCDDARRRPQAPYGPRWRAGYPCVGRVLPTALAGKGRALKLAVLSDTHLDAPFVWAGPEVARRRRRALRDALSRAVELAVELEVDAVLCGGDLYEHDRFSSDTGQFLRGLRKAAPDPRLRLPGQPRLARPAEPLLPARVEPQRTHLRGRPPRGRNPLRRADPVGRRAPGAVGRESRRGSALHRNADHRLMRHRPASTPPRRG